MFSVSYNLERAKGIARPCRNMGKSKTKQNKTRPHETPDVPEEDIEPIKRIAQFLK